MSHLSASTKIMNCDCEHEFQNKRYGNKMRVHNPMKDGDKTGYRCTVCGKEKKQTA